MEHPSASPGEAVARPRERKLAPSLIYSVELEVFEGPLDLLLHLVRKHELDILDIPIAFITEKYLEYLDVLRALDLEIAGDYLVMAATLAYLKSRELLPSEPRAGEGAEAAEEDGEDPREALIRRLLEYERFKQAAQELDSLPVSGRDVFARGADIDVPPLDPGIAPVSLFSLAEAYYRVLTRAKVTSTHDVTIEAVTVKQRMEQLTLMLDEKPAFAFEDLFLGRTWASERELRQMLVVTLMSILELVKLGVAGVQQVPDAEKIQIYRRTAAEQAHELIAGYDEETSFGAPAEAKAARAAEADADAAEEAALLAEALAAAQEPAEPVESFDGETEEAAANDVAEQTDEPAVSDVAEETGDMSAEPADADAVEAAPDDGEAPATAGEGGLFVNTEGGLGDRLLVVDDEEDGS
jgi:segregation and condensation protein A